MTTLDIWPPTAPILRACNGTSDASRRRVIMRWVLRTLLFGREATTKVTRRKHVDEFLRWKVVSTVDSAKEGMRPWAK